MTNSTQLIRTPDQGLRMFVSSTLHTLAGERRTARLATQRLRLIGLLERIHYADRVSYTSVNLVQELHDLIENNLARLLSARFEVDVQSQLLGRRIGLDGKR